MYPIVIGVTGSSGCIYAIRLLEVLHDLGVETHLVVSKAGLLTLKYESDLSLADLKKYASRYYSNQDITAPIASGSFKTQGMIVIPCSMKTLGDIAHGVGGTLIGRAADVVLKERRRLVLMPRETPLHLGHLENMVQVTRMGGIIAPPMPSFYTKPSTIEDLVNHSVGRILDLFGIETGLAPVWNGL